MEAQPTAEMGPPAKAPQPTLEAPIAPIKPKVEPSIPAEVLMTTPIMVPLLGPAPVDVPTPIKIISLKDDMAATPTEAPQEIA
ncbi:hypothetical protein COCNU_scaffold001880G000050 [Cocos nucifera]|nr:hypothetical protein [Cocos nucifera]